MTIKDLFITNTILGPAIAGVNDKGETRYFGCIGHKIPVITSIMRNGDVILFSLTGYDQETKKFSYQVDRYTLNDGHGHFRHQMHNDKPMKDFDPKLLYTNDDITTNMLIGQQSMVFTKTDYQEMFSNEPKKYTDDTDEAWDKAYEDYRAFQPMPTLISSEDCIHQLKENKDGGYTYDKNYIYMQEGLFPFTDGLEPDEEYTLKFNNITSWAASDEQAVFFHDGFLTFVGQWKGKMICTAHSLKALIIVGHFLVMADEMPERDEISYLDLNADELSPNSFHLIKTETKRFLRFIITDNGQLVGTNDAFCSEVIQLPQQGAL
jgi:hypothetical protein